MPVHAQLQISELMANVIEDDDNAPGKSDAQVKVLGRTFTLPGAHLSTLSLDKCEIGDKGAGEVCRAV